jgi:hypothetical protein
MTPITPQSPDIPPERRRLADAKRAARALRIRTIRRRIAGGAAALFVTAWVFITVQLVTGHDPALARPSASRSTSAVTASPGATTTTTTTTSPTSATQTGSGAGSSSSSGTSSVTTRQS